MSFILDALKKSENQRQRQIGPSLADIPLRRARADRPWWAVAVAALLVINLGVLIVVLTRNRADDAPSPPPAAQPTQIQQSAPAIQPQQSPPQVAPAPMAMPAPSRTSPAVRSLAEEAGAGTDMMSSDPEINPELAAAGNVPEGPPVVRPITPPTVTPIPNQGAFAARTRVPPNEEVLPTHNSLIASGTSLPEMKLDIHVYSANPSERFVFVNMRKYTEGQTLNEGSTLERITADGAILNHQGTRFLLPRQ